MTGKLRELAGRAARALARPVDAASLALFRICFGSVMCWQMLEWFYEGKIAEHYVGRSFHFTYPGFEWVRPWPGVGMYVHFAVLAAAALLVALGLFYRLAALVFFLGYTHVFLIDQADYNNHYYLICLLSFFFVAMDAHHACSLDARRRASLATGNAPAWNLFLMRAQIFIVYLYAGLAKINPDWLGGEPLRLWLSWRAHYPVIGPFLDSEAGAYLFSYLGLFFDLAVGPLLLWRRSRPAAVAALVFFNAMNAWLFVIGAFPFLMIAAALLFFEPSAPRRWLARFKKPRVGQAKRRRPRKGRGEQGSAEPAEFVEPPPSRRARTVLALVCLYLSVQALLPFRHWLYPGWVDWTEEGRHFAWRMKIRGKYGHVGLLVSNPRTGTSYSVEIAKTLDLDQYRAMSGDPYLIWRFARHVAAELPQIPGARVRALTSLSLNSRPPRLLIDPQVDLVSAEYRLLGHNEWVLPLHDNEEGAPSRWPRR